MNQYVSRSQYNEHTSRTLRKGLEAVAWAGYDASKAVIDFIRSMVMMFLGKY